MNTRMLGACLLATSVLLAACDDDNEDGASPQQQATIRLVNATGAAFDLGLNGQYTTANTGIAYGAGTACQAVDANGPALTIRQNGTTTVIPNFTPAFTAGGKYTLVVSGAPGSYKVTQYADTFPALTSGNAGIRVINATSGTTAYNLFVGPASATVPTTATRTNFGSNAFWTSQLAAGSTQVWLGTGTGTTATTVFTSDPFTTTAGQSRTFVVADPASGSTALRSFFVNTCT